MVCSFAASEQVDIFPCGAWVESHVVDVGTYPAIPACFGQVDEVMIAFVDLFEFELEVGNFVLIEIAFVLQSMSQSVFFFDRWNEDELACFVLAFAFGINGDCCFATSARNSFTESVIGHVVRGEFVEVFIVQFALFIFFADFSPIDVSAIEGCFLFVFK